MATVLDFIESRGSATAKEIITRLKEKELPDSQRTFERLKDEMRDSFGLELVYEKPVYRLVKHEHPAQDWLFHMIQAVTELDFFKAAINNPRYQKRILFDESEVPTYYHHLQDIFEAIVKQRRIKFTYHFIGIDRIYESELEPYLLKKHRQRWYVVGRSILKDDLRNFALDRMQDVVVSDESFKFEGYAEVAENYSQIIGINYSGELCKVVIRAFDIQSRYLSKVPLHHSQEVVGTGDDYIDYSYDLRPNYELKQELMRISNQIRVMEPEWLREEVVEMLEEGIRKAR